MADPVIRPRTHAAEEATPADGKGILQQREVREERRRPGDANPGGAKPGDANPGGANPGGANPGGANPGGDGTNRAAAGPG